MTNRTLVAAARWYLSHMGPVLALRGKSPAGGCGVTTPIRTAGAAEQWFGGGGYNIGLRLDRYLVFDVDSKRGATLADLGPIPVTPTQRTPSGGWHVFFRLPGLQPGHRLRGRLGSGIDVKYGPGHQVAACPTPGYVWEISPRSVACAECPRSLLDRVVTDPAPNPRLVIPTDDVPDDLRLRRASAYLATLPPSIAGQGGDMALWRACTALVRGFRLRPSEAHRLISREFNPRCRPPWDEHRLITKLSAAERCSLPDGYLLAKSSSDSF